MYMSISNIAREINMLNPSPVSRHNNQERERERERIKKSK